MLLRLSLVCLSALVAGCATSARVTADPTKPIATSAVPYTVAVLDEVRVMRRDGQVEVLTVSQDGLLPLGDEDFRAVGLSAAAVEQRVRAAHPGARRIEVREFRPNRVTVLGEVFHQIHTDLGDGPMRVMDAIAAANGFTPIANRRRVRLLRENAGRAEIYEFDLRRMMRGEDLAANFLLEPGDVITVPRNFL